MNKNNAAETRINGIIYKATNMIDGKVYIGLTTKTLELRKSQHLLATKYEESKSKYFYSAINKHKQENFSWEIIDKSDNIDELNKKEVYWIKYYNSYGEGGYNLTRGGGARMGSLFSEESRLNIPKGSEHHKAKIDEATAIKIKDLILENTLTNVEIGELFGVSKNLVSSIKCGYTWKHIISDVEREEMNSLIKSVRLYSDEEVIMVKNELIEDNLTPKEISELLNVSLSFVNRVKKGKRKGGIITEEDILKMDNRPKRKFSKFLSEEEVSGIKTLFKNGVRIETISNEYGISTTTLYELKSGNIVNKYISEKDIEEMNSSEIRRERSTKKSTSHKRHQKIKKVLTAKSLLIAGVLSTKEIADDLDLSVRDIEDIRAGRVWNSLLEEGELEMMKVSYKHNIHSEDVALKVKKELLSGKLSRKQIKKKYNITDTFMTNIARGTYTKIEITQEEILKMNNGKLPKSKLTDDQVREIRRLIEEGNLSQLEIAEKYNVLDSTISNIKTGRTFSNVI